MSQGTFCRVEAHISRQLPCVLFIDWDVKSFVVMLSFHLRRKKACPWSNSDVSTQLQRLAQLFEVETKYSIRKLSAKNKVVDQTAVKRN